MNTESLVNQAKTKFTHNLAKAYIKEKYKNKLILADQGGLWKVTADFISMLDAYPTDQLILIDTYENPIKIDRNQLLTKASVHYTQVMEEYLAEWTQLKQTR
ncbi:MAG: hypothetical protein ACOVLB_07235 [Candidatus Nanopelagicus sp.]